MNNKLLYFYLTATALLAANSVSAGLRAPAVPLVTLDPYSSCWSMADNLYDDVTRHWTGTEFPLIGVVSVDGDEYRFMGREVPVLLPLAPTANAEAWLAQYTTSEPSVD